MQEPSSSELISVHGNSIVSWNTHIDINFVLFLDVLDATSLGPTCLQVNGLDKPTDPESE